MNFVLTKAEQIEIDREQKECILCGSKKKYVIGVFIPNDKIQHAMPWAGRKVLGFPYALCKKCCHLPENERNGRVEDIAMKLLPGAG